MSILPKSYKLKHNKLSNFESCFELYFLRSFIHLTCIFDFLHNKDSGMTTDAYLRKNINDILIDQIFCKMST